MTRQDTLGAILDSIIASPLPEAQKGPLREAMVRLGAERPNAVDKVQAPLGRALRNPAFPGLWSRCVADIPTTPAYAELRLAAAAIEQFVAAQGR